MIRSRTDAALAPLAGLLLAACIAPAGAPAGETTRLSPAPGSAPRAVREPAAEPVLYARDGTPIRAGAPPTAEEPVRGLEPKDGSRMYLLELYQEAIDAKETLELEARSLSAELERARETIAERERELAAESAKRAAAEAEIARLSSEAADLAARLATAQIRRLEVEKLLLEAKLQWLRAREASPPAAAGARPEDDPEDKR